MNSILSAEMQEKIQGVVAQPLRQVESLSGGKISQVLRIDFASGEPLVAKIRDQSQDFAHDFTIEAYMLRYLRQHSDLPVPEVHYAASDLLLMEYIEGESEWDRDSLRHLGELMAGCHRVIGPAYGLERDTLIGALPQPNPLTHSWIAFFREQRLGYISDLARSTGCLPAEFERRLRLIAENLDQFLIEPGEPALIHGDMWRTNVLVRAGKVVAIIDPALYYAHREVELAYMLLFDSIGDEFFSAYHNILPIDEAFFSLRRHVYNLYPLVIHLIYFGDRYLAPLDETLTRLGF